MKKNFKSKISLAACALLSASPQAQAEEIRVSDLEVNTSVLYYTETDRVTTVAPQINIKKTVDEDNIFKATALFDAVSGATPTGEVPYGEVQTVTSASGTVSTVSASTKPTLSFEDDRVALSASWTHQLTRLISLTGGGNMSSEGDYDSQALSFSGKVDTEDRLSTWNFGFSNTSDDISRSVLTDNVAGIPSELTNTALLLRQSSQESRESNDVIIGLTQVLTSRALFQVSLTRTESNGYHSDPYKVVSVVDGNGLQVASFYEKRPENRTRDIIYTQLLYSLGSDILRLTYRHHDDNWGVKSQTYTAKYRMKLDANKFFEPSIRYYSQSAADFHRYYLRTTDSVPDFVSADSRLAEFTSMTYGISAGYEKKGYKISGRLEYMAQESDRDGSNDPIKLQEFNLFSGVEAVIVQLNASFYF